MSTHPNVLLMAHLKPDDLSRKTYRAILDFASASEDVDIRIGNKEYHHKIMEDSYDEGYQISADLGDIVVFDLVTYGYGEAMAWPDLVQQVEALSAWCRDVCERFQCSFTIKVGANYW